MRINISPRIRHLILIALITTPFFLKGENIAQDSSFQSLKKELIFSEAHRIRTTDPDSSIRLLELSIDHFLTNKDTINTIHALRELAIINGNLANYVASYDVLWKALLLADAAKNDIEKERLYIDIGRHYSFYKRKKDAMKYFQLSLDINKRLLNEQKIKPSDLIQPYYSIASTYRELGEAQNGKLYLDSCYMIYTPDQGLWYKSHLEFERAFILRKEGKYLEALEVYNEITPWFQKHEPTYFVLLNSYIGDVYQDLNNLKESENYYKKSLEVSKTYNSHIDFTPLVHEKLAKLYVLQNDYPKAYASLNKAKELDAIFFDSRSKNNRPLFEIQDAYRQEKEHQKELIRQQHIKELETQEQVSFLQKVILIGAIISLFLIGLWYFNYVQSKHKAEKLMIKQKQELEIQKANELVELKNKELATSALKLIEKDELFSALKGKLKNGNGAIAARELKQIIKSNSVNNARNWKEFEARFISVNESFYQSLSEKYPNLSQGDQKLCALIKLNFSSKEMSKLLGISIESVHTSRYRLRKKLKLSREINLTNFIANL